MEGTGRCHRTLAGTSTAGGLDLDTAPGKWDLGSRLQAQSVGRGAGAYRLAPWPWVGLDFGMVPGNLEPRKWAGRRPQGLDLCMAPGPRRQAADMA